MTVLLLTQPLLWVLVFHVKELRALTSGQSQWTLKHTGYHEETNDNHFTFQQHAEEDAMPIKRKKQLLSATGCQILSPTGSRSRLHDWWQLK